MKKMFLAILLCKLCSAAGRLLGKGSSLPGKIALKICPEILRLVEVPREIIAVTGSNGKTSTVELIAAILKGSGKRVAYNKEGANQIEGVTTLVLNWATLQGKVKADVLLLECDERYTGQIFAVLPPTKLVVTNLFRDQITRNGHPEWVYDAIRDAIPPETKLLLNADDPLSSCLGRGREGVTWFGMDRCALSLSHPTGIYHDGACCPVCKGPMEYAYVHFNHIGAYSCPNCGHAKPKTDCTVTAVDLESGEITMNGEEHLLLAFHSVYHVYNVLAAYAAAEEMEVPKKIIRAVVNDYVLKNGRTRSFFLGKHQGTLLTSKHENSISYDTNLRYIVTTGEACTVLIIVDTVSRKYFTCETSWLWDIDFEQLNVPCVKQIVLSGRYCNDLAQRFSFTGLRNWSVQPDIFAAVEALEAKGSEKIYAVTCFADRDKLLDYVELEQED